MDINAVSIYPKILEEMDPNKSKMLVYKVKSARTESSFSPGSLGSEGNKKVFQNTSPPKKIRTIADVENNNTPRM